MQPLTRTYLPAQNTSPCQSLALRPLLSLLKKSLQSKNPLARAGVQSAFWGVCGVNSEKATPERA
jgi:hypothetical protein